MLRILVSGANTGDSIWMLPVCSVDTYGNVSLWRVGCERGELARCKYSGYLPLLRTMSNKSRRRRYHIAALYLSPSPIIPFSASVAVHWFLRHSRLRYLTLVLTLYIYALMNKSLILGREKHTTDASHPFPSRKYNLLKFSLLT